MPSLAGNTMDIRSMLGGIVNMAKSKTPQYATSTCDGLVLRMHYRWTFWMFLGSFFSVWYSWYNRDVITCVSHYNADTQVRLDYVNICLSYPYVEGQGQRRYLLFYRWIHWIFLLLAGLYYLPRKLSKSLENPKTKQLLERLAVSAIRNESEQDTIAVAAHYVSYNFRTHNGLFFKYIAANCFALLVDIGTLLFLNFVLQGRFLKYGLSAFPYDRDVRTFSDPMSRTFPPFAMCELDRVKLLAAERHEMLGCHLVFMELYEKVFLFLWFWLYLLISVTSLYIIGMLLVFTKCFHRRILATEKSSAMSNSSKHVSHCINDVTKCAKVGDIYLLYCIKHYFSHFMFYELLVQIGAACNKEPAPAPDTEPPPMMTLVHKPKPVYPTGALRNRAHAAPQPAVNPEYLQSLLGAPDGMPQRPPDGMSQRQPMHMDGQRKPLLAKKESSVLIDSEE